MAEDRLKEAFIAGFLAGEADAEGGKIICPELLKEVVDRAFEKWKEAG